MAKFLIAFIVTIGLGAILVVPESFQNQIRSQVSSWQKEREIRRFERFQRVEIGNVTYVLVPESEL